MKFRKKEFKDFSTRNSLLHIGVDGLVEGDGQIAHAASSLLLRRVEAGGVLQVLLPLLAALLAAEFIVPTADVALSGDGADKLAHRLGRAAAGVVADALVHLLQAIALLVDLGDGC